MIKASSDTDLMYMSDNIYESYPMMQENYQQAYKGQVVSYYIRVQNEGAYAESMVITGDAGSADWQVRYFSEESDITADVTGFGYTTASITSGGYATIRLEVTPISAIVGMEIELIITAKSSSQPDMLDTVKARVRE